jgi:hypothetical protein
MSTTSLDSTGLPHLRDVEGTPIPLDSRVEQVTVDEEHGALPSLLHQQGHAVGRGTHLLYVRFDCDKETVALRPQLARPHHGRCLTPTTTLVTPQRGIDPAASTVRCPGSRHPCGFRLGRRPSWPTDSRARGGALDLGRARRAGAGRPAPRRDRHSAGHPGRAPVSHPHWPMSGLPARRSARLEAQAAVFSLRGLVHRSPRAPGTVHALPRRARGRAEGRAARGSELTVSGPARVLGMVDTSTGHRHFVAVEVVPLHRRCGRYPALCGEVLAAGRLTAAAPDCQNCVLHAAGQPRRRAWKTPGQQHRAS